jgi:hypothetical protein
VQSHFFIELIPDKSEKKNSDNPLPPGIFHGYVAGCGNIIGGGKIYFLFSFFKIYSNTVIFNNNLNMISFCLALFGCMCYYKPKQTESWFSYEYSSMV